MDKHTIIVHQLNFLIAFQLRLEVVPVLGGSGGGDKTWIDESVAERGGSGGAKLESV